jgi:hypothetical protein
LFFLILPENKNFGVKNNPNCIIAALGDPNPAQFLFLVPGFPESACPA